MDRYWWLVIVVGAFFAWQIVKWVVGRGINITDAGRVYLEMQLKELGVWQLVPNGAIIELADRVSSTYAEMASDDGKSNNWAKTEMMPYLLSEARLTTCWLMGDPGMERFEALVATMKKFGVGFGAAKRR